MQVLVIQLDADFHLKKPSSQTFFFFFCTAVQFFFGHDSFPRRSRRLGALTHGAQYFSCEGEKKGEASFLGSKCL